MSNRYSILAISDIHFGCPRVDPNLLSARIRKYVFPRIPECKILFICGDFFDNVVTLNAKAAFVSIQLINDLRECCRLNGCDLRVLRGTYTHDRDQPRHFVNGIDPSDMSVRVFDTISFEHHDKTGLNIIYIPDNHGCDDVYEEIRKLLESHNVEKADIIVHHGYFKHMLPEALLNKGLPHGCLEEEKIRKYVRHAVLNGHVHVTSVYKNVISVGSFDRLAHGEEGPKGFYKIDIEEGGICLATGEDCDNIVTFRFIENKEANKFITFNLLPYTSNEDAFKAYQEKLDKVLPTLTGEELLRARIITDDPALVEECAEFTKKKWSNVRIDRGVVPKREQIIENVATDLSELPTITDDNLRDLLMPILKKFNPFIEEEKVKKILEEVGCKPKK